MATRSSQNDSEGRVNIKYQVYEGDAIETKELPFVLGVMADLSGTRDPERPMPGIKHREFLKINRESFDVVLREAEPRLQLLVSDGSNQNEMTQVNLSFQSLEDFEPEQIAKQIPDLNELLELRRQLNELRNTMSGNEKLKNELFNRLNSEQLQVLGREIGYTGSDALDSEPKK